MAAFVRGPIGRFSPMSVPSRSRTTRRIGNRGSGLDTGNAWQAGKVALDRDRPGWQDFGDPGDDGIPLVGPDLEEGRAAVGQRVREATKEAGDHLQSVGTPVEGDPRLE